MGPTELAPDERPFRALICPHCRQPLYPVDGALGCDSGHRFDLSRNGYCHLVPGHRHPRYQGDSAPMLAARRRFLTAGHYAPLASTLTTLATEFLAGQPAAIVADIGGGEGYMLRALGEALPHARRYLFDYAKDAVRLAAGADPQVRAIVADVKRLIPLADGAADFVLNNFAPRNGPEFARLLAPTGRLVVVLPGPDHLAELRAQQLILNIEKDKRQGVVEKLADLTLAAEVKLTIPWRLTGAELADLLLMMPARRVLPTAPETRPDSLAVTAVFHILTFAHPPPI